MKNNLVVLKAMLWVSAVGFLLPITFILLPWTIIKDIYLWFGVEPISSDVINIYVFKIACVLSGMFGVFLVILAKNPLKYGAMLSLGSYGLLFFGVLSFILGLSLAMPVILYIGDALFGLVLGFLIMMFARKHQS